MKTPLVAVVLAVITTFSTFADISVTTTNQQPPSLLVRNSIVPMLRFVVRGSDAEIASFTIQATGLLSSTSIGKVSIEAQYLSYSPFAISTAQIDFSGSLSQIQVPVKMGFTGEKTYVVTVNLEMDPDLSLHVGENLRFLLVSVDTQQVVSGILPIYGEYHVINNTLSIGSISVSPAGQNQNLSIGGANQVIGAFATSVGPAEAMISTLPPFYIETPGQDSGLVRNVVLVDSQNTTVAGPVDVFAGEDWSLGRFTFTDTVVFPKGGGTYYLKASLGAGMKTNGQLRILTNPQDWLVWGQLYGYRIKAHPFETIFGPTMTLEGPELRVSLLLTDPTTAIQGVTNFRACHIVLTTYDSSEDIRITSLPLTLSVSNLLATDISNCQLFDSETSVTAQVNPTTASQVTFTFDGSGIVIPAGTSRTLSLRMSVRSGGNDGTLSWSVTTNGSPAAAGMTSANSPKITIIPSQQTVNVVKNAGAKMTSMIIAQRDGFPDDFRTAIIAFQGAIGLVYVIQESTNLVDWKTALSDQALFLTNIDGTFSVKIYLAPGEDFKFFRAIGMP